MRNTMSNGAASVYNKHERTQLSASKEEERELLPVGEEKENALFAVKGMHNIIRQNCSVNKQCELTQHIVLVLIL